MVNVAITHTTDNIEELTEITDIYDIPVVDCSWVVMSNLCGKLLPHKAFPPKQISRGLFRDACICATNMSQADMDAIWAMVCFNGGSAQRKITENTTHLITTMNCSKMVQESRKFKLLRLVTPDWVVDCLKSRSLLNETSYHPSLLMVPAPPHQLDCERRVAPFSQSSLQFHNQQHQITSTQHSFQAGMPAYMPQPFHGGHIPTSQDHLTTPRAPVPSPHFPMLSSPLRRDMAKPVEFSMSAPPLHMGNNRYPPAGVPSNAFPPNYPQSRFGMPTHSFMGQHNMMPVSQSAAIPSQQMGSIPYNMQPPAQASATPTPTNSLQKATTAVMGLGQMTEVPCPSQATMPEETPIIRMSKFSPFSPFITSLCMHVYAV